MSRRRGPNADEPDELLPARGLLDRAGVLDAGDEPTPALRDVLGGGVTTLTTETPPWLPPSAYPFRITWWPLAWFGHDEVLTRDPLYAVEVDAPGEVVVPTARRWSGSVCICVVYADGSTEWVGR